MYDGFLAVVGYILGILVVLVISGVFLKPIRFVMKLVLNSLCGIVIVLGINLVGARWGVHIGINPFTAIALGIMGVPGIAAILLAQIFY